MTMNRDEARITIKLIVQALVETVIDAGPNGAPALTEINGSSSAIANRLTGVDGTTAPAEKSFG